MNLFLRVSLCGITRPISDDQEIVYYRKNVFKSTIDTSSSVARLECIVRCGNYWIHRFWKRVNFFEGLHEGAGLTEWRIRCCYIIHNALEFPQVLSSVLIFLRCCSWRWCRVGSGLQSAQLLDNSVQLFTQITKWSRPIVSQHFFCFFLVNGAQQLRMLLFRWNTPSTVVDSRVLERFTLLPLCMSSPRGHHGINYVTPPQVGPYYIGAVV